MGRISNNTMKRKYKSNAYTVSIISRIALAAIGFLDAIIINRYLGVELKGQYSYFINIINIATLISNFGMYQAYFNFKKQKKYDDLENKFLSVVFVQLAFYCILSILFIILNRNINILVILIIPISTIVVQLSFLNLSRDINYKCRKEVAANLLYLLVITFFSVISKPNIQLMFLALILKQIFLFIPFILPYKDRYKKFKFDFRIIKDFVETGTIPMLSLLLVTLNYRTDVLMLKWYVDFTQIGYYTLGISLVEKVWLLSDACKEVLLSKNENKPEEVKFIIKINMIICIAAVIFVSIFGKFFIVLLFGAEYAEAYKVTIILFTGTLFMVFYKLLYPIFLKDNMQKRSFIYLSISLIVNIILNIILVPIWGIYGAATATLISYIITGILFLTTYNKKYNTKLRDFFLLEKSDIEIIKKLKRRKGDEEDRDIDISP